MLNFLDRKFIFLVLVNLWKEKLLYNRKLKWVVKYFLKEILLKNYHLIIKELEVMFNSGRRNLIFIGLPRKLKIWQYKITECLPIKHLENKKWVNKISIDCNLDLLSWLQILCLFLPLQDPWLSQLIVHTFQKEELKEMNKDNKDQIVLLKTFCVRVQISKNRS